MESKIFVLGWLDGESSDLYGDALFAVHRKNVDCTEMDLDGSPNLLSMGKNQLTKFYKENT